MSDNELMQAINKKLSAGEFPMAKQAAFWESMVWSVLNLDYFQNPDNLRDHIKNRLNDE
jgi:hypothetical protein